MAKSKKQASWVGVYDNDLNRNVSWDEMQQTWYREHRGRRHFVLANHPFVWAQQSNWLHVAARSLWEETEADGPSSTFERQKVALMLSGMSLECALKSRLLTLCKYPLSAADQKRIFSGNHDLVALATSAHIRTNSSDRTVLMSLSTHVRWLGRYPTARSADEMAKYWVDKTPAYLETWQRYNSLRDKIGHSLTRSLKKWHPRALEN